MNLLTYLGTSDLQMHAIVVEIRKTPQRNDKLKATSSALGVRILELVLDVDTRWSSIYYMFERALLLKRSLITLAASEDYLANIMLCSAEWNMVQQVRNFLKSWEELTALMEQDK